MVMEHQWWIQVMVYCFKRKDEGDFLFNYSYKDWMKVGAPSCFQFFYAIKSLEGYNNLKTQASPPMVSL